MLVIVDYGAGNQTSVGRAFAHLNIPAKISANPEDLAKASGIVFPGVGNAAQAMEKLHKNRLDAALVQAVANQTPLLGICLGCQILLEESEEGSTKTLGIVKGSCREFDASLLEEDGSQINIPHIGWNSLRKKQQSPLLSGIASDAEFYFVHSYFVDPDPDLVIATTTYGSEFCSIYGRDGLWAVQFHPEKSGRAGLRILSNFNSLCEANALQTPDCMS